MACAAELCLQALMRRAIAEWEFKLVTAASGSACRRLACCHCAAECIANHSTSQAAAKLEGLQWHVG